MIFHSLFQLFDFRIFPKNILRLDGFKFFKRNCLHKENVKNNVFASNCKTNTFQLRKRFAISPIVCELRKGKINGTYVGNGIKSVSICGESYEQRASLRTVFAQRLINHHANVCRFLPLIYHTGRF